MESMVEERYPGECRVLRLFLTELEPVALRGLGADSMLYHSIRRALSSNALAEMRRARRLFNVLPRDLKQRLSDGLVERAASRHATSGRAAAAGTRVLERFSGCEIDLRIVPRERNPRPT
jgi:hypothetical protein